jgi:hypothetical protein
LAGAASAATKLPPLPKRWPRTFQLGLTDSPGGAAALRKVAPFGFRYQYLAGGVNTGQGWSTWNPDGSFVSMYVRESAAAHEIPVFPYYLLLQSKPAGGDELHADLANVMNADTMRAYWADVELFMRRARAATPVVLHVEPDFWGYAQQAAHGDDAATVPAVALDGLPQTVAGFAQSFVRLRDRLAPNVILAWHLSGWGTKEDITYSKPALAHVDSLARRSARFYRSLHARFDIAFTDVADRDAGFKEHVDGNPKTWWGPADFHRNARYLGTFSRAAGLRIAIWQIPLGNTSLADTWGRYRDNRVQWWLDDPTRAHLKEVEQAGVVALLFGGGADGTTSAKTDGGFFYGKAKAYYGRGALRLP